MAAPKPARLPIIDIAPWLSDDPAQADARAAVSAALHSACVTYGFFYLDISSYVPKEEPEQLTTLAREFFALPQEEKERILMANSPHFFGYSRFGAELTKGKTDQREQFDFGTPYDGQWVPGQPDYVKLWGPSQVR